MTTDIAHLVEHRTQLLKLKAGLVAANGCYKVSALDSDIALLDRLIEMALKSRPCVRHLRGANLRRWLKT
jgi:hypothetical protein